MLKARIFSVRADENFMLIRADELTRTLSANEKLELEIQARLDQNPGIDIKHIQFSSLAVVPKNASWQTTNTEIEWEIEKSVPLIYECPKIRLQRSR